MKGIQSAMREQIARAAVTELRRLPDGTVTREFSLPKGFVGFAGHFPGYPILPAVGQLLLAQLVAEEALGRPLCLREVDHAKFTRPIRPVEAVRVDVRLRDGEDGVTADAVLQAAGESASKFRQHFSSPEEE